MVSPFCDASCAIAAAASYPMMGAKAVQIARPSMTISGPLSVAVSPLIHCLARFFADVASNSIDSRMLCAATGIMTLSSKLPD